MNRGERAYGGILSGVYRVLLDRYGPQGWWPIGGKYFSQDEHVFEIMAGALLTQNTSWKNASRALDALRVQGLIDPDKISGLDTDNLASLIRSSGYYNQKAERLKGLSSFYIENILPGGIPRRNDLLAVSGIGPETADSILLYAFHMPVFIVDMYTKRLLARLGLLRGTEGYDQVQNLFMRNLPPDSNIFGEYHALIVRHGKQTCRKNPLCGCCALRSRCAFSPGLSAAASLS